MLLLSDYELIGQNTNGIEIIKKLNLKNSILVTSHFDETDVQRSAIELDIPVIPKLLATKMTIQITPSVVVQPVSVQSETALKKDDLNDAPEQSTRIDIIMLEDDPIFAAAFQFRFMKKKSSTIWTPEIFWPNATIIPKTQ